MDEFRCVHCGRDATEVKPAERFIEGGEGICMDCCFMDAEGKRLGVKIKERGE